MAVRSQKSRGAVAACVVVLLSLLAALLSGCFGRADQESGLVPDSERITVIYAADFEFAPFRVSTEEGYFGYEIDVNTAIFAETKYKLQYEFRDLAIDNLEELAKSRDMDIFGWRVITPVTQQHMLLSDPVYEFNWGAVTLPDIGTLTEADYAGYKIGIVHKKYPYNYLVTSLGLDCVLFDNYSAAAEALVDGEIDIWFEEREIANYYLIRTSHYATTVFHEETVIPVQVGLLIRPDLTELHAEINRQIKKMKEQSQLESFYYRHFQKHSREYLEEQERNIRNIILICVGGLTVMSAVIFYILHINRKYRRATRQLSLANLSLEEAKERFSAAVDGANDGILYYSERVGRVILSERFCEILGTDYQESFERDELFRLLFDTVHPKHHARLREFTSQFKSHADGVFFDEFTATSPRSAAWISVRVKFERHGGNWVAGGVLSDITERKEAEAQTLYFAQHDYLTGIYNRQRLLELAGEHMMAAREKREQFYVLYLDLDNFKRINDTLGHDYGDEALRAAVAAVQGILPADAIFARVGGDEFVVVLPGLYQVEAICGEMNARIAGLHIKELRIGASIGVACYPKDRQTVDELIVAADRASRHAKAQGKNSWKWYAESLEG